MKPGARNGGKIAKLAVRVTPENAARIRAAFLATGTTEGDKSLTEMLEAAIVKEVRRRERKYNDGDPWPTDQDLTLKTGPRL